MEKLTNTNFNEVIGEGITLVDFYADWCGPCKMMAPVLEELAQEIPNVKFRKVNVDEQQALAGQFSVMSIPTLVLFKDGQVVTQAVGFNPKPMIEKLVQKAL